LNNVLYRISCDISDQKMHHTALSKENGIQSLSLLSFSVLKSLLSVSSLH